MATKEEILAEAQANLLTVNAAIEEYIKGTRRTSIKIGTATISRTYFYSDKVTLEDLRAYRNDLLDIISAYDISLETPTFKKHMTIPMYMVKGIQNDR